MMNPEAISAYRSLLRARRKCFAGDTSMLVESRRQIRDSFDSNRHVSDPARLQELLADAREAVNALSNLVVQARLNERGNYEMKINKDHVGATLEEPSTKEKRC